MHHQAKLALKVMPASTGFACWHVRCMLIAPEENNVWKENASNCATLTRTVFKVKFALINSAGLDVMWTMIAKREKAADLENVSVKRDSSTLPMDVRTLMSVKMAKSALVEWSVKTSLGHMSANVHQELLELQVKLAVSNPINALMMLCALISWPVCWTP